MTTKEILEELGDEFKKSIDELSFEMAIDTKNE